MSSQDFTTQSGDEDRKQIGGYSCQAFGTKKIFKKLHPTLNTITEKEEKSMAFVSNNKKRKRAKLCLDFLLNGSSNRHWSPIGYTITDSELPAEAEEPLINNAPHGDSSGDEWSIHTPDSAEAFLDLMDRKSPDSPGPGPLLNFSVESLHNISPESLLHVSDREFSTPESVESIMDDTPRSSRNSSLKRNVELNGNVPDDTKEHSREFDPNNPMDARHYDKIWETENQQTSWKENDLCNGWSDFPARPQSPIEINRNEESSSPTCLNGDVSNRYCSDREPDEIDSLIMRTKAENNKQQLSPLKGRKPYKELSRPLKSTDVTEYKNSLNRSRRPTRNVDNQNTGDRSRNRSGASITSLPQEVKNSHKEADMKINGNRRKPPTPPLKPPRMYYSHLLENPNMVNNNKNAGEKELDKRPNRPASSASVTPDEGKRGMKPAGRQQRCRSLSPTRNGTSLSLPPERVRYSDQLETCTRSSRSQHDKNLNWFLQESKEQRQNSSQRERTQKNLYENCRMTRSTQSLQRDQRFGLNKQDMDEQVEVASLSGSVKERIDNFERMSQTSSNSENGHRFKYLSDSEYSYKKCKRRPGEKKSLGYCNSSGSASCDEYNLDDDFAPRWANYCLLKNIRNSETGSDDTSVLNRVVKYPTFSDLTSADLELQPSDFDYELDSQGPVYEEKSSWRTQSDTESGRSGNKHRVRFACDDDVKQKQNNEAQKHQSKELTTYGSDTSERKCPTPVLEGNNCTSFQWEVGLQTSKKFLDANNSMTTYISDTSERNCTTPVLEGNNCTSFQQEVGLQTSKKFLDANNSMTTYISDTSERNCTTPVLEGNNCTSFQQEVGLQRSKKFLDANDSTVSRRSDNGGLEEPKITIGLMRSHLEDLIECAVNIQLSLSDAEDEGGNSSDVDLLKEQLKSLSTELVTLRSSLKEGLSATDKVPETMKRDVIIRNCLQPNMFSTMDDLIHLSGPLTEDSILRALQTRFYNGDFYTRIGPILLSVNPYHDIHSSLTLSSTAGKSNRLLSVVQDAVAKLAETGHSQAIILSGVAGSGKTYASMQLLRQLFDVAGGGPETDTFKHLSAAFTVLRSLGNAKIVSNTESSRMGQFIEVHVTDGALYRTKIHCYFIDQARIVRPQKREKNYHIFYQMLAGLTQDEKVKLYLEGFSPHSLQYLSHGDPNQNEAQDAARFESWKSSLGVLGIPFMDVMRVLAAVVLLGNIEFVEGQGMELDIRGNNEIKSVAALLGISAVSLYKGLTTRTRTVKGQIFKSLSDAQTANRTRDALAKALYSRTVAAVVRRANSLKSVTCATLSSGGSNESVHNQADMSRMSNGSLPSSRSPGSSNGSFRSDGFIGIVDMFGFENCQENGFEQLCINLCAETMQHFYNTHIFKSTLECAKDEGIKCEIDVDYNDNAPCIELISSQRTGLLSLLDSESLLPRSTNESYLQRVRVQHRMNPGFFEPPATTRTDHSRFGIRHYMGDVVYDTRDLLHVNRDSLPDDVITVFHKLCCSFGFATHIFSNELKNYQGGDHCGPRGQVHRVSPCFEVKEEEGRNTLSQDYYTRLDNLIKTLVHCRPHFIRCIKSNENQEVDLFDREAIVSQIRGLEVLETVNLMAEGFSHRMRFKAFSSHYRFILKGPVTSKQENKTYEECKAILDRFAQILQDSRAPYNASSSWAIGHKHIFLSEITRQQLENLRLTKRGQAAVVIQKNYRRWHVTKNWPSLRRTLELRQYNRNRTPVKLPKPAKPPPKQSFNSFNRPRPQPIIESSDALEISHICDQSTAQGTAHSAYGLDMELPPPIPARRPYTVAGNAKVGFPHVRIMLNNFQEDGRAERTLLKGEEVKVIAKSAKAGHLTIEHRGHRIDVPFSYMTLPSEQRSTSC